MKDDGNYRQIKSTDDLPRTITMECACGRKLVLTIVGGQYDDTYRGDCECGLKWQLWEGTLNSVEDEEESDEWSL